VTGAVAAGHPLSAEAAARIAARAGTPYGLSVRQATEAPRALCGGHGVVVE